MAKEPRGAIVSVRISQDEQVRLRRLADERGVSVSELLRTAALAEIRGPQPSGAAVTAPTVGDRPSGFVLKETPGVRAGEAAGVLWDVPDGALVEGNTITL
jgi:hypothetical protein